MNLHKKLKKNIKFAAEQSTVYQNKKRDREPTLKKRDKVYLLQWNIKTTRSSKKLNYIKMGPFWILKKKESVNYQLNLSAKMRKHSVFHISLLESVNINTLLQINPSDINLKS